MSANQRIQPFLMRRGGMIPLDPDYQAVLDYAILQGYNIPDLLTQQRDNLRVINLKNEGVWAELDVLYIFEQSTGCSDFARINFKDPANHYLTAAPTYSIPTFEAGDGFKGGTGLGFNTNWNLSTDPINFINNDACFIAKGYDSSITGTQLYAYARTANNTNQCAIGYASTGWLHRIATTAGLASFTFTADSHSIFNRSGSTRQVYENGSQVYTNGGINGPGAFSNLNLYLMCGNENGTTIGSVTGGLSYIGWGSDQSAKATEIYEIMAGIY